MIKSCPLPPICGVAGCAILTELPIMFILLGMAGVAVLGSALKYFILVTILASDLDVHTGQREGCPGVVESSFFPGSCGMALGAVLSKLAGMSIILQVACRARLRRSLQIC